MFARETPDAVSLLWSLHSSDNFRASSAMGSGTLTGEVEVDIFAGLESESARQRAAPEGKNLRMRCEETVHVRFIHSQLLQVQCRMHTYEYDVMIHMRIVV